MLDEPPRPLPSAAEAPAPVGGTPALDAAIERERQRLRAVHRALPDPVWLKDPDGVYLACNPQFERLYGAPEAQIRGRTDFDFVPREVAEYFRAHDRQAIAAAAPSVNVERLRYADDGHEEWVQTIKTPVHDEHGALLGVLGIARDISALRQAEADHRALFDHNPTPMLICARDNLSLLAVNGAFCQLYGHSHAQALALDLVALHEPADRSALVLQLRELSEHGGRLAPTEWRQRHRDGSALDVMARAHDIEHLGRACHLITLTDIGAIKRSQQRDRRRLALMERLARGDALEALLDQLVRDHEALFPDSLGSILLVDEAGLHLRAGAAPSLPADYTAAIDGIAIGPAVGSCGAAAHGGQRVVVGDIAVHANWAPYRELARAAGLRACWSEPIIGPQGRVLGTFAVYRRAPAQPSQEELEQIGFSVQLAASAIGQGAATRRRLDSEQRLRTILQAIPDLVWLTDAQGRYQAWNEAFAHQFSGAGQRLLGQPATAFELDDAPQDGPGATPVGTEHWLTRANGERRLYEVIRTPLLDAAGRLQGRVGVARDITGIKAGAQAIAEGERLIDTMFGQTTDSIVLVDPQTSRFITFNDAAWRNLGYTREAFAQLRPVDLQLDLSAEEINTLVQPLLNGAPPLKLQNRHRCADGSVQVAALTLSTVTYAGHTLIAAVWRDITEDERQAARIQRLNQAYAVLSGVNEAIVRLRDRGALFREVCRIAVQAGGFRLAWIGGVSADGDWLEPLAIEGPSEGYVESLRVDLRQPNGLAGNAMRSGEPQVENDIARSAVMTRVRERARAHGLGAAAALPIRVGGQARYALLVYSTATGWFDAEQVGLLRRLALDVGFALDFEQAEQAQRKEQRFSRLLIESVAGVVFAVDPAGRLLQWNRHFEDITGQWAEAIGGQPLAGFFAPEQRERIGDCLQQALREGEARVEAELLGPIARSTPYLFVARRLDDGAQRLIVGTGVDIGDRVRSEAELARYRQGLEELVATRTAALESANQRLSRDDARLRAMLALSRRAGDLDEPALFQEGIDTIARLTGSALACVHLPAVGPDAPVAAAWSSQTPAAVRLIAERAADGPAPIWQAVQTRRSAVTIDATTGLEPEVLAACPPGVRRAIGLPVLAGGAVQLIVCAANKTSAYDAVDQQQLQLLASDLWAIIERRRIEIALGQAKRAADAANQAKSAFLANMSHEIRTPMNAILGFAHLLRREALNPQQLDHLARIGDAGQHLLQVINDILDFSKVEAHKVELDATDFVLRDAVERVRAMLADRAAAKQVALAVQVDADCPAVLCGDRLRLEQVLLNLVSNAVKFTDAGRVDVRVSQVAEPVTDEPVEPVEPSEQAPRPVRLRFEVRDTGVGVPTEQLPQLFEAFRQADASITRRFGGTGLGLAISQRLAQLMGGHIEAHSRVGEGSRFTLELTLAPARDPLRAAGLSHAAAVADTPLAGARVLLVEDNLDNQEVARAMLVNLGAEVEVVGNGQLAVEQVQRRRPDLVLMDVQMPVLDGLQATRAIRALPGGADLPIVALTAAAFAEDRERCLAAGMNAVLTKPVRQQQLAEGLSTWWTPPGAPPTDRAAGPIDPTRLREALQELRALIASHDSTATDRAEALSGTLAQGLGARGTTLLNLLRAYRFETALALVEAALREPIASPT